MDFYKFQHTAIIEKLCNILSLDIDLIMRMEKLNFLIFILSFTLTDTFYYGIDHFMGMPLGYYLYVLGVGADVHAAACEKSVGD